MRVFVILTCFLSLSSSHEPGNFNKSVDDSEKIVETSISGTEKGFEDFFKVEFDETKICLNNNRKF